MPSDVRSASRLDLPPPFTLVTLREVGDAFAHACQIAPEQGAGTLLRCGAECAVNVFGISHRQRLNLNIKLTRRCFDLFKHGNVCWTS